MNTLVTVSTHKRTTAN